MTIQQLKIFQAVCEHMNFSKAAEACFISRQALRQNISAMEQELNAPLFLNTSNHISLTETGEKLKTESTTAVEAFDRMMKHMDDYIDRRRTIHFAISQSVIPDYIPNLNAYLSEYRRLHPEIRIEPEVLLNDDIANLVASGLYDCGLIMDLGLSSSSVRRIECTSDPCAIMMLDGILTSNHFSIDDLNQHTIHVPGNGIEFSPLLEKILERNCQINMCITPSFYQAYYGVREHNDFALNRFRESDFHPFQNVRCHRLDEVPSICSSLLLPLTNVSPQIQRFCDYLQRTIQKDSK